MAAEQLIYWMKEREAVRCMKETDSPKPWSMDPVFQTTYFCNVRREHDKTTRWIRKFYSPYVKHRMFTYNLVLARFLNRIETLDCIGFVEKHDPKYILDMMNEAGDIYGKIWGGAYIITTHGLPMGKAQYLVENVLGAIEEAQDGFNIALWDRPTTPTLAGVHGFLMRFEGLGSFLAAQLVADMKNTEGHPLKNAPDWKDFVAHGPGSLRGASWFHYGEPDKVTPATFYDLFQDIRKYVDDRGWSDICSQDLQNCLCEFDKYMRVKSGLGRSKRNYAGVHNGG